MLSGAAPPLLSAVAVAKTFGATRALRGAKLALAPGEVHALLGENGAGKSTLVKILCGVVAPDAGSLEHCGRPVRLNSVRDALQLGIVPMYQHLSLMPHLSVRENLFAFDLARGAAFRTMPPQATRRHAVEMLGRVGLDLDPGLPVGALSLAERQLVEIARGIARECAVLILDEPTASLNRSEVDRLFDVMRGLCRAGRAVLFISHNLGEVEEIADRISVLRDGISVVEGVPRGALSRREIVERMVGRQVESAARHVLPQPGQVVLEATAVSVRNILHDAALTLRSSEILGIVGLIGSGATELGAALAGLTPAHGRLRVGNQWVPFGSRTAALKAGVGLVPGERESDGLFQGRPVIENASVAALAGIAPAGWLRAGAERMRLLPWLRSLRVVPDDPDVPIDGLSGGNQQKVLVGRALAGDGLHVLVALEPTRGVDVGARQVIHEALVAAARRGLGIVLVSSDLDEVTAICHRILVMRDGRVAAEFPGKCDQTSILRDLTGAAA